ncbi:MAG: nucleotidyltransferase domain-containing protein [Candidatus Moraniibacteriota bacterium]
MDKKVYTAGEVRKKVKDYARYLRETHHVPVQGVYLFGSYAKHKAHAWSDIDVCIISPLFIKEDRLSFLWHRRRGEDVEAMIAPIGFAPEDFRGTISSPLVHEIKTTGEEISLEP